MRVNGALLGVLAVVGCAAEARSGGSNDCISDNPPGSPFAVGDVTLAAPPPGSPAPAPEPPSAMSIAAECVASGGTGCDSTRFISRDAASCIATLNAFDPGLVPWQVALVYHHRHQRVVWNVTSELQDRGADGYSGAVLTIDATEGAVLEQTTYAATP